jgi:hypothetical protein
MNLPLERNGRGGFTRLNKAPQYPIEPVLGFVKCFTGFPTTEVARIRWVGARRQIGFGRGDVFGRNRDWVRFAGEFLLYEDRTAFVESRFPALSASAATRSGETSAAVVGECLFDFLTRVHDERPVLNHRLA